MRKIAFSIGVVLLLATSLQAQTLAKTAADMVKICADPNAKNAARNPALALNAGYCLGYFQGVLVTHYLYHQIFDRLKATPSVAGLERANAFFCAPIEVSPDEARKVFLKYMNDHPEKLHEDTHGTVLDSLMASFPCKS